MSDLLSTVEHAAEQAEEALEVLGTCIVDGSSPERLEEAFRAVGRVLVTLDGRRYGRKLPYILRVSNASQDGPEAA